MSKKYIIGLGMAGVALNIIDLLTSYNKLANETNPFATSVFIMIMIKAFTILLILLIVERTLKGKDKPAFMFFYLSFLVFMTIALLIIVVLNSTVSLEDVRETELKIKEWQQKNNTQALEDFATTKAVIYFNVVFSYLLYPIIGSCITYFFYSKAIIIKPANKKTNGMNIKPIGIKPTAQA